MFYSKPSTFPKDFLWGASTSAYQVEGCADSHGKGLSVQDLHRPINQADFKDGPARNSNPISFCSLHPLFDSKGSSSTS